MTPSIVSIALLLTFIPVPSSAQNNDMSAEAVVKECERRTGFKATDPGARAFIFRRCVQTIQTESKNKTLAETKTLHRKNLQTKAQSTFNRRGTGDRTLLRHVRPQTSKGVRRVYTDQVKFQSVQFNRSRTPDLPDTPKEQKMQRANVDNAQSRYELEKLAESCPGLVGFRKDLCIRTQLHGGSARRWTKESRQR